MNHKPFASKINLFVLVLILAASIALVTAIGVRATYLARLEELARIKDEVSLVGTRHSGASRLEELARIKER